MDFFGDLLPDHVDATITTDGGCELSKSFDMLQIYNNHRYEVNTIAVNAFSQNEIDECSHQTLKKWMRYMLYSSQLGTEFWADTLIHVTWLYN